jgi:N4-gp56 family major capsid protein
VSRYDFVCDPWDAVLGSADVLVDLIKSTQERIRMVAAFSGSNVIYNSPAVTARNQVNGVLTLGRVLKGTTAIGAAKGRPFTDNQVAVDKFNTTPIESGYYFFHHTNMAPDIRALNDLVLLP